MKCGPAAGTPHSVAQPTLPLGADTLKGSFAPAENSWSSMPGRAPCACFAWGARNDSRRFGPGPTIEQFEGQNDRVEVILRNPLSSIPVILACDLQLYAVPVLTQDVTGK